MLNRVIFNRVWIFKF